MNGDRLNNLIKKYADGSASEYEVRELTDWYRQTGYQDAEFPQDEKLVYNEILEDLNHANKPDSVWFSVRRLAMAATIAVLLGVGSLIYILNYTSHPINYLTTDNNLNPPGGNRAILTLANGKKISLTNAAIGHLVSQGGMQIAKASNGQVVYTFNSAETSGNVANSEIEETYNTIETPVGGQYQVILPDKSRVWLNAQSSIRFPVSFDRTKERLVELAGEAYFEVEHDARRTFKVITRGAITEDIGTSFNIKAYGDEAGIKMTLITGAAKITAGTEEVTLKPGEQADCLSSIKVSQVNIQDVIAWKEGYFRFEDDTLEDIMKLISRWYDIQYVFQDQMLRNDTYGAVTTRFTDISTLLNLMEQTGSANFRIEGTKIIITRKKTN